LIAEEWKASREAVLKTIQDSAYELAYALKRDKPKDANNALQSLELSIKRYNELYHGK